VLNVKAAKALGLTVKLPIAPIFIADSVSLAVFARKGPEIADRLRRVDDAKVVEPSEVLEVRAS